jgi:3-hydroxyisobutyrate dehydrogenase
LSDAKPRVGFIGLGLMGMPMARNVLKAGYPLTVHNRSRGKVDEIAADGAKPASSPAELAAECDVVLSCVPMPADVLAVYLGENGVVSRARPGQILCDMSTVSPETHKQVAEAARARGAAYLDAPISGGVAGARDGSLAIMVGGDQAVFDQLKPLLEVMGKNIYLAGPVGAGTTVKLINQMMLAICGMGVFEGLVLGAKAGIDPTLLVEIISSSSGFSRALANWSPGILKGNFAPGFYIDLLHKDVALALDMARQQGVRAIAAATAEQIIQEARAAGHGREGTAGLIQPLEKNTGIQVRAQH